MTTNQENTLTEVRLPTNDYEMNDGVTHINMKLAGWTDLGKILAMEAPNRFRHPVFGNFESLEGYWYYIRSGCQDTNVRGSDSGYGRRRFGTGKTDKIENFQEIIGEGIYLMLKELPEDKLKQVLANTIPLDMYFIHYGHDDNGNVISAVVQRPSHFSWYVPLVESVIKMIRDGETYPKVNYGDLPQRAR